MRVQARKTWRFLKEHAVYPGAVTAILVWFLAPHQTLDALQNSNLLSSLISAATILAGFFCTGMTVILSLEGKPVMALMDEMGIRHRANASLWAAARWVLVLSGACIAAMVLVQGNSLYQRISSGVVSGLIVASALSSWRAVQTIAAILHRHARDAEDAVRGKDVSN